MMKYQFDWRRERKVLIDSIEHTISYRMKRDLLGQAHFQTLIVTNDPNTPQILAEIESKTSEEMYEETERKLKELSKTNYELGDYI